MQIFIESTDIELWKIVNNGPHTVPKIKNERGKILINQKISIQVLIGKYSVQTLELNKFSIVA